MALAQARQIDAVLVTELSRWGRSTQDLVQTLDNLHSWKVSVLAQTGLTFDLSTAGGKLMRTIMAGLAEFERDLIRERVKSGLAGAKARGVKLGRRTGYRPSDKKAKKVISQHAEGLSYRTHPVSTAGDVWSVRRLSPAPAAPRPSNSRAAARQCCWRDDRRCGRARRRAMRADRRR